MPPAEAEAEVRTYRHLGGDPVEVFEAEDGHRVEFDPTTRQLGELKVREAWSLGEPLGTCLGDPLALPPAGDVAGFRKLAFDGEDGAWRLELSGRNPCALSGRLDLPLRFAQVDVSGLRAHELPWKEGGREAVLDQLRAELLAHAEANWASLDAEERLALRRSLSESEEGRAFLASVPPTEAGEGEQGEQPADPAPDAAAP